MEVFGITGSISQSQTGPDVMEGDSAEMSRPTVCDLRVGSSSQNENSIAPPAPKRMRLDTDRMEQPAAKVPFHSNDSNTPLTEAEQERLLAQSGSLPHYILQESDITKKQVKDEVQNAEIVEFTKESKAHSKQFAGYLLCPVGAEKADSDVTVGQTKRSLDVLQDDEPVVKSHYSPITCINARTFEKCAMSTYSDDRDSGVTAESSVLTTDDFQQEFYDDACLEDRTKEYRILRASHSVSDSSSYNVGGNPYGTLSGYREVGGGQDRSKSLFRENAHACDGESKVEVNEERIVYDEEMADYVSTGSVFTYDVASSGDLGSNEPEINASLAHRVPSNAALWLSTAVEAGDLHKGDEYTAISAQSGLSQMPSNVCNDMAAVTGIDAGHEGNGADLEIHMVPEHRQLEVNCSQASDSTPVTTLHCASEMTLHGIIALEEDTAQCPLYPVAYTEGATVRNEVCEPSDDHCVFVPPLNCDIEHLNIAHIPESLPVDDEHLVINCIGLSASQPRPNGCTEEKATTEDITRIHHHSLTFGSFTKPAESFDISAGAVVESYTVGAHADLLALANLVCDPVGHHESVLEGAVVSSAGGMVAMGDDVFFESSPSLSQMRQKLLSEDWEEKSEELSDRVVLQQPVTLPQEENAKVTDTVAYGDTSHDFTIKDKPMFTLSSDAIVPTPTKLETEESPVRPGRAFSDCVPLGFDSFEKVKISPDSDLENSPLLDSSLNGLAAVAVTHLHTVSPPGISQATLTHSAICLDETTELISQDSCPVSSGSYSQERGIRRGREESPNSISINSLQSSSQQQHLCPLEPEENIRSSYRMTDHGVPLFEMKEMFDLVIEELHLYFEIGQEGEEEESKELSADSRKEDSTPCYSPLSKFQDGAMPSMSSGSILETEQEEVESSDDQKELDCEQEVPLENGPLDEGEDSMYSTMKTKEFRTNDNYKPWSPAFLTAPFLEHLVQRHMESPLKRLEPLKTCSRPIRVGLSKKARTKQLHPNLK